MQLVVCATHRRVCNTNANGMKLNTVLYEILGRYNLNAAEWSALAAPEVVSSSREQPGPITNSGCFSGMSQTHVCCFIWRWTWALSPSAPGCGFGVLRSWEDDVFGGCLAAPVTVHTCQGF